MAGQTQDGVGQSRFQSVFPRRLLLVSPPIYVTLETPFLENVHATIWQERVAGLRAGPSAISPATLATAGKVLRSHGDRDHRHRRTFGNLLKVTGGVT